MVRGEKAQGAIEFVIIFSALLVFFIIFFTAIQINVSDKNREKGRIIIQDVALDVKEEINIASEASEGYIREFKTPENILGQEYDITLVGNTVYLNTSNYGVSYRVANVTGEIMKGSNTIKKEDGEVKLNS